MSTLVTKEDSVSTWRLLNLSYDSPFRNVALEEALARKNCSEESQYTPTVRFWRNPNSVVIGRFQEAAAEVDLTECKLSQVQVARRFTGGGTVFQDEGTLNFTVVTKPADNPSILKFQEQNMRVVTEALDNLGLGCSLSAPNSILADGRKICGAAAALGKIFAFWHCSIMVTTNTRLLERVLSPSKARTLTRFVHSKWNPVTTVATVLSKPISIDEVTRTLIGAIQNQFRVELEAAPLSVKEEECSRALLARKYSTNEWNLCGNRRVSYGKEGVE
jgi:lipoate-protein ligase A